MGNTFATYLIEGQFLNHPSDQMRPWMEREVGERVVRGLLFSEEEKGEILDSNGKLEAGDLVHQIARKQGKINIFEAKYNKTSCGEIGKKMIELLRNEKISFLGDLRVFYEEKIDGALVEIYAEMFSYAITRPEEIKNDATIMTGVSKILSLISEREIRSRDLWRLVDGPSEEILLMNQEEKLSMREKKVIVVSPDVSQEGNLETQKETVIVPADELEHLSREDNFTNFVRNGIVPEELNINQSQRDTLEQYAELCRRVIAKYPSLESTNAQHLDTSFDPNFNMWNIKAVEYSVSSLFIRDLLLREDFLYFDFREVDVRIEVLENFLKLDSP